MKCSILLGLLVSLCASVAAQQEFIVNGQEVVDIRDWPWQGSLHQAWTGDFVCGCSLIDREWAITAARCVMSPPYYVSFGSTDRDSGTTRRVREIIIAENYTSEVNSTDGDVAVLKIDSIELSDTINTVELGPTDWVNTWDCYITGWGYTINSTGNGTAGNDTTGNSTDGYAGYQNSTTDRTFSQILNQGRVHIEANSICEWFNGPWVHDDHVCTGPRDTSVPQSTCKGDEGGPLVCSAHGSYLMVGIASWQSVDCLSGYSVYARVSSFMWWIGEVTGWQVADAAPVRLPNGDLMWH